MWWIGSYLFVLIAGIVAWELWGKKLAIKARNAIYSLLRIYPE